MLERLQRLVRSAVQPQTEVEAYGRLAKRGFRPDRIIDVGAYKGDWACLAHRVFPDAPVLLIEAQEAMTLWLHQACRRIGDARVSQSLLASRAGMEVTFYEMGTGSSIRSENSNVPRTKRRVVTSTLDQVVGPGGASIFLKLDVQGAELDVLEGGQETLARSAVVQLETALLPYNEGAPLIGEVLGRMDQWDFVPLDVAGFIRPNGIDLVQMDILFVPRTSSLRMTQFVY